MSGRSHMYFINKLTRSKTIVIYQIKLYLSSLYSLLFKLVWSFALNMIVFYLILVSLIHESMWCDVKLLCIIFRLIAHQRFAFRLDVYELMWKVTLAIKCGKLIRGIFLLLLADKTGTAILKQSFYT